MDTPSQEMTKVVTESATDARGRNIVVRKLRSLDRMKVFELIGGENAKNEPYLGYAVLAYSVVSIDGNALPTPSSKLALEAIVKRLDDEGLAAAAEAFAKLAPASADESEELVKN
jgi:hypothetical protein